ncbi:MAG TPA: MFS transporter [Telluria sp.]|nr:MFS transporter [Telluria sp.]
MTLTIATLSPKRERLLLWLLAFTQFTVIMDFMVMMPLAPQLMRAFSVGTSAVSGAVSAYAWCAGLSGLFAATYIDRFDRKRLLLTVFCLFALSNLACALAPTFEVLLLSRAFAGLSGGIMGSIVMAVIADVIPVERRGAAAGIVMTSFGMAAVAGVPTGILLAAHFNWAAPFYVLVLASAVIWAGAWIVMPRLDAHLAAEPRPFSSVLPDLLGLFAVARHRRAFLLTGLTMMSGMMVVPFIAPVMVGNLGVQPVQMSWVYLCGGLATLFSARAVGRWTDRIGPARTFGIAASKLSRAPLPSVTKVLPRICRRSRSNLAISCKFSGALL